MKNLKNVLMAAVLAVAGIAGVALSGNVFAAGTCPDGVTQYTNSIAECGVNQVQGNNPDDLMGTVQTGINVVLGIIGVVAVIVIILGGFYYVTSQGDAAKVTRAKNTILYGVVGLIIALLAFAIVNFVLSSVFGGTAAQQP